MAAVGYGYKTLLDQAKEINPDGTPAKVIDVLSQRNPLLQDAPAMPGNLPTGHRYTVESTRPAVAWARFNEGVDVSKGTTEQFDEVCGRLKGFSEIDADLLQIYKNPAEARAREDKRFVSALNDEVTRALIYASTAAAPEQIHGFMPRYDLTTRPFAGTQITLHTAAPSGADQSSILFVTWGEDFCTLIYPEGTTAGLKDEDKGKYVTTKNNKKLSVYGTEFTWWLGLLVQDYRQVARIANIDNSALSATGTDLIEKMVDAYYSLHNPEAGRVGIYVPRRIAAFLHKQAMNKTNVNLALGEAFGKPVTTFMGWPVRMLDAMTVSESIVS